MSAQTRIRDLVQAKLVGRKIDVVGFIDDLLDVAKEAGEIHCTLTTDDRLRFERRDWEPVEVKLDACRGKLRMLCARLSVLCQQTDGAAVSPYGGNGIIHLPSHNGAEPSQWTVSFMNTPAEQQFTIAAVAILCPAPNASGAKRAM